MVYFDLLDSLTDYTKEEIGELFLAMLEYGATGVVPDFEDRGLRTLWKSAQQKIDRDNIRYQGKVKSRQYATYCRECKKSGSKPLTLNEWKNHQMISNDNFDIQLQPQLQPQLQQKLQPQRKEKVFEIFADQDPDLLDALKEFDSFRKKMKKPLTEKSKERLINKLKSFPKEDWIPILHKSIDHGWTDIYELKGDSNESIHGNGSQHSSRFASLPDY